MLRSDCPIALPYCYSVDYDDTAGLDMDQATGDKGHFVVTFKCQVVQAGLVVTETCAGGTTTPIVAFDRRPTAGSDASRGSADIANIALATTAAGKVMYDEAARGTILYPGDEVVVELTQAASGTGSAGHVRPYLLVEFLPEMTANLTDMVETA